MAGEPQVDFALDTYECIVIYPGAAGRALPPETVQRLQAEHTEHMQALQRSGIILVAGSVDGPARTPEPPIGFGLARTGSVDDVRSVLEADPAVQAGPVPGGCADLPVPGGFAGVSAGQGRELTGRPIGGCRDDDGVAALAGATVAPTADRSPGAPGAVGRPRPRRRHELRRHPRCRVRRRPAARSAR